MLLLILADVTAKLLFFFMKADVIACVLLLADVIAMADVIANFCGRC